MSVTEFIQVIKDILAKGPEDGEDDDINENVEELRIISEEEEALLNVWNLVTNKSTGKILKKKLLRLIECNFNARRILRRVHPEFEIACRQKFFIDILLLHNTPPYADKFWIKQKHLKFGKVDQGEFIEAALYSLVQYRKQKVAKAQLKRVLLIQKICRGFVIRRKTKRNFSAQKIQNCYRCYIARQRVKNIRFIRQTNASIEMERVIRGHLGRRKFKRHWFAREIQRVYRGFKGREQVKELKAKMSEWVN